MTIPTFHVDGLEQFDELLSSYRDAFVSPQYATEMRAIAERAAIREAANGYVAVSNDYRSLPSTLGVGAVTVLAETSCRRFERAGELIAERRPTTSAECFSLLTDATVRMDFTVQSMVLSAKQSIVDIRLPTDS